LQRAGREEHVNVLECQKPRNVLGGFARNVLGSSACNELA
jgi:hypothetical protein